MKKEERKEEESWFAFQDHCYSTREEEELIKKSI
jgi:hypothetical protein